jgi:hypothetical protein
MQPLTGWKIAGVAALCATGAVALAACTTKATKGSGPMAALTDEAFSNLHPDAFHGARQIDVATGSVREVRRADGSLQGTFDGTRLLRAADAQRYGAPRIADPALDVKDDGAASWNEVREVLRHFDVDASDGFDAAESRAYQAEVGVTWNPGVSG